jgi:predicted Zn-dependent protease
LSANSHSSTLKSLSFRRSQYYSPFPGQLHRDFPCFPLKIPNSHSRRFSSASQRSNGRGNDSSFQTAVFVGRAVARIVPQLYKSAPVQQFLGKNPKLMWILVIIPAVGAVLLLISHAERVPFSGRLQFLFLNSAAELNLGSQAAEQVIQRENQRILGPENPTSQQVQEITRRILRVAAENPELSGKAEISKVPWRVSVIESNVANAFVLPNGDIFVYTGLLPLVESENGLAVVLAHEITHALAHHSNEKMGFVALLMIAAEFVRGSLESQQREANPLRSAVEFGLLSLVQLLLPLSHSRKMESEADRIGLELAANSGYNPAAGVRVWENMKKRGEKSKQPPAWLSTHPAHEHRIENMQRWAAELQPNYRAALQNYNLKNYEDRPIIYHPTKSSTQLEQWDKLLGSEALSQQSSSLIAGPFQDLFKQQQNR